MSGMFGRAKGKHDADSIKFRTGILGPGQAKSSVRKKGWYKPEASAQCDLCKLNSIVLGLPVKCTHEADQ